MAQQWALEDEVSGSIPGGCSELVVSSSTVKSSLRSGNSYSYLAYYHYYYYVNFCSLVSQKCDFRITSLYYWMMRNVIKVIILATSEVLILEKKFFTCFVTPVPFAWHLWLYIANFWQQFFTYKIFYVWIQKQVYYYIATNCPLYTNFLCFFLVKHRRYRTILQIIKNEKKKFYL